MSAWNTRNFEVCFTRSTVHWQHASSFHATRHSGLTLRPGALITIIIIAVVVIIIITITAVVVVVSVADLQLYFFEK